ncbi:MAG: glycosyltransferase family 39 protein [Anaerolineaceae bacterium]|nr:glycosyltransferase family 39 protein [Anaerolineaceae bacterium]
MNASHVLSQSSTAPEVASERAVLTLEWLLYAGLLALAFVLRLAQIDVVPLTSPEAREALSAWRAVVPGAAGLPIIAQSPLLFTIHSLSFSLLGASEFTVRLGTLLAGSLLVISPALFRDLLGRGRALLTSVVLLASPTLLAASRYDSPVVWTVLLVVLTLWAFWRWWESDHEGYALAASGFLGAALLLSDPTAPVLILILIAAGGLALWLTASDYALEEAPGVVAQFRARMAAFPWSLGLLIAALVVVIVSTQFLSRLDGLSAVGELLSAGLGGVTTPRANAPLFYPLVTSLFYSPMIWFFAVVAIWLLARKMTITVVDRFLVGWLAFTVVGWLLYVGGGPEQALWAVVPLAVLVSGLLLDLLAKPRHPIWTIPGWSKLVLATLTVILLFIFTVHGQAVARSLLNLPPGTLDINAINTVNLVWMLMTLLLGMIGVFIFASMWGMTTTIQGSALGILAFALFTGIGSGWNIAVTNAANATELWHMEAPTPQTALLRDTLRQLAERGAGAVNQELELVALVPQDGLVAWLLRDFSRTQFINEVSEARGAGIVLLPQYAETPDLGGDYVGHSLTVLSSWSGKTLNLADLPAWWSQRRVRVQPAPLEKIVLWLRQDIYNGVPFDFNGG